MPSQEGRLCVITGTGGLGYETAVALAVRGADVILAGRNPAKGAASIQKIRAAGGLAARFEPLDLASLASVAEFAGRLEGDIASLDLLVNNAGVMAPPARGTTADGFELQFGTNYLGHSALTAHLLPLLRRAEAPRVVSLSSGVHVAGAIRFDDPQWLRAYSPTAAYSQSKLAMLMFALELQRRSDAGGWRVMSTAAHPGFARTELIANGPGHRGALYLMSQVIASFASQSAADGALPTLYAATSPEAVGGAYYGPSRMMEMKGPPKVAFVAKQARNADAARRLWELSERLTGTSFPA